MRRTFAIAVLLLGLVAAGGAAAAQSGPSSSFRITGAVRHPQTLNLAALQTFPAATEDVSYFSGSNLLAHAFTGALLWDLLDAAGIIVNPNINTDILRKLVVVTGSDGYKAVFSVGEIDPYYGGEQVIAAYEEDGKPILRHGFAQIVAPGDKTDGRWVWNIVTIEVKDAGK